MVNCLFSDSFKDIFLNLDPKNQAKNSRSKKIRIQKTVLPQKYLPGFRKKYTKAEKTHIRNVKILKILSLKL